MGLATITKTFASMGIIDPRDYGAVADGETDCTVALNAAITAATPGTSIYFPPGTWLFNGNVTCKQGVSIQGANRYHSYYFANDPASQHLGTIFAITGGAGTSSSSATAFLTPPTFTSASPPIGGYNCAIENITFWYPNQGTFDDNNVVAYPYTIGTPYSISLNSSAFVLIKNCSFVNSYQAIRLWRVFPFVIEDCHISAAVNGIWVDGMFDTSAINRVMVEPIGFSKYPDTLSPTWVAYAQSHLTAYRFGRVDSLLMDNCMCYPAKTGVLLEQTQLSGLTGPPWLFMSNCVLDAVDIGVDVQAVAVQGVQIANCTSDPTGGLVNSLAIRLGSGSGADGGVIKFANCGFSGSPSVVSIAGGRSRFIGCTFRNNGSTAIAATGGDVTVLGCDFMNAQPQMTFAGGGKAIFANNTTASNGVDVSGVTPSNCV